MRFEPFALERMQSTWENRVAWNLAESGVHPLRLEELAETTADRDAPFGQELGYTQTNGTPELRSLVASMYPGATAEHVEVTNGGSEANCVVLWRLLDPDGEMVMIHLDIDRHIRIGFGNHPGHLSTALQLTGDILDGLS